MLVQIPKGLVILLFATSLFLVEDLGAVAEDSKTNKDQSILNLGSECVNAFWPIDGTTSISADVLTSPFGVRFGSGDGYDFHEGIDIRARTAVDVHAYTDGSVKQVQDDGSDFTDNYITLEHQDPCDGNIFYTGYHHLSSTNFLQVGDPISAGIPFVVTGTSGADFYHLHFAGMVGGIDRAENAINPMREDSFNYVNGFPWAIIITDNSKSAFTFEVDTRYDELDLNEIEVNVLDNNDLIFDTIFMNFDTRHGVDSPVHSGENGDGDGRINGTTVNGYAIVYEINSFDFNPDFNFAHTVEVIVTFPSQWLPFNRARVRAIDTQGLPIEAETDVVVGINDDIAITGPDVISENEAVTYTGTFFDVDGSGTSASPWDWELRAQKSGGGIRILDSATTSAVPQPNGDWETEWTFTVPELATFNESWIWSNDKVQGSVYTEVTDSDFFTHTDELFVLINATPETPTITTIEANAGQIDLNWNAANGATSYNVYRDNEAYSALAEMSLLAGTPQLTYTDSDNPVGNIDASYYYVVTGVNTTGESGVSNRVGEADYQIGNGWCYVALPFSGTGISDAEELGQSVSGADAVYRMNGGSWELMAFLNQGSWVTTIPDPLGVGRAYLVGSSSSGAWTTVGDLAADIVNSFTNGFNSVMLPLLKADQENILDPVDMGESIDNSPASATGIWRMSNGSWVLLAFDDGGGWVLASPDDTILPGGAYLVDIDVAGTWGIPQAAGENPDQPNARIY